MKLSWTRNQRWEKKSLIFGFHFLRNWSELARTGEVHQARQCIVRLVVHSQKYNSLLGVIAPRLGWLDTAIWILIYNGWHCLQIFICLLANILLICVITTLCYFAVWWYTPRLRQLSNSAWSCGNGQHYCLLYMLTLLATFISHSPMVQTHTSEIHDHTLQAGKLLLYVVAHSHIQLNTQSQKTL